MCNFACNSSWEGLNEILNVLLGVAQSSSLEHRPPSCFRLVTNVNNQSLGACQYKEESNGCMFIQILIEQVKLELIEELNLQLNKECDIQLK